MLAREASVNLAGATVLGGDIDVSSNAGDMDLLAELGQLSGANATWAQGLISNALPGISDIASLPISFLLKEATANLEVGQGTAQDFNATQVNGTTGEINFAAADNLNTGDSVTYASTGAPITGLTSGATYFVIADSGTTLRLASTRANAINGIALSHLVPGEASGTQSLTPNSQIAGSSVNLTSNASSDAEGEAIYFGQFGSNKQQSQLGLAFAIAIGIPTANTLVDSGTQVTSAGNVNITSTAASITGNVSRVNQNLGALNSVEGWLATDGSTEAREQLSAAIGIDSLTAKSIISQYANIDAGGNDVITATGNNLNANTVSTASYYDGIAGAAVAFNFSIGDIQAIVDGSVTSGTQSDIGDSPTAPVTATFNPFTTVHGSNDPTEPNTLDFGTTDPGFTTGEAIIYDSGAGGTINGLTSGNTYYVIVTNKPGDHRIQLAASYADATAAVPIPVVLAPIPILTDTVTGVSVPFTQVDQTTPYPFFSGSGVSNNQIQFLVPPGLTANEEVTYTSTGNPVGGLTSGGHYYVIPINSETIELAAAPGGKVIPLDPTQASGDQTLAPFGTPDTIAFQTQPSVDNSANTINLGLAHGFTTGEAITYTSAGAPLTHLQSGNTYYVIVINTTTIQLAATYANATASTPVPILVTSVGATGTEAVTAQTPIQFGFDPGFQNGDPLKYTAAPGQTVNQIPVPGQGVVPLVNGATYYALVDPNNPNAAEPQPKRMSKNGVLLPKWCYRDNHLGAERHEDAFAFRHQVYQAHRRSALLF